MVLFWRVWQKWRLTSFNDWWMLWLVWSLAHTNSTEAYPGYYTLNCTGSVCPSESRTSSASWCIVACMVKRRSTWSTSVYQSQTSLLGSISSPPVDDSCFFRVTDCKCTADRLSLLLARWPGTHCRTIWEIRVSLTRDSFRRLLKTHLFALYWSIQCIRGFTKMHYTNLLLTYLHLVFASFGNVWSEAYLHVVYWNCSWCRKHRQFICTVVRAHIWSSQFHLLSMHLATWQKSMDRWCILMQQRALNLDLWYSVKHWRYVECFWTCWC